MSRTSPSPVRCVSPVGHDATVNSIKHFMIKFIPKTTDISSPLSDPEIFANNLANKSLAAQLNEKLGDNSCPDHPNFENQMLVHFTTDGDLMTVQTYCCDTFKEKLGMVAKNQNPFSSDTTDDN